MTVTLPSGIKVVNGGGVTVLITGTYNQSQQGDISTWYTTIGSNATVSDTFTVQTNRTASQLVYNLNVFFSAFTNTWDNSTYDYVVIG